MEQLLNHKVFVELDRVLPWNWINTATLSSIVEPVWKFAKQYQKNESGLKLNFALMQFCTHQFPDAIRDSTKIYNVKIQT